jgi:hypothetical protein
MGVAEYMPLLKRNAIIAHKKTRRVTERGGNSIGELRVKEILRFCPRLANELRVFDKR